MAKKQKPTNKDNSSKNNAEIKHYIGAITEHFEGKMDVVIEHFKGINDKLDSHTEMIGGIAQDVEIIKADIEFLKGGMKKKVDYDEFLALERRLSLLESKTKR